MFFFYWVCLTYQKTVWFAAGIKRLVHVYKLSAETNDSMNYGKIVKKILQL